MKFVPKIQRWLVVAKDISSCFSLNSTILVLSVLNVYLMKWDSCLVYGILPLSALFLFSTFTVGNVPWSVFKITAGSRLIIYCPISNCAIYSAISLSWSLIHFVSESRTTHSTLFMVLRHYRIRSDSTIMLYKAARSALLLVHIQTLLGLPCCLVN